MSEVVSGVVRRVRGTGFCNSGPQVVDVEVTIDFTVEVTESEQLSDGDVLTIAARSALGIPVEIAVRAALADKPTTPQGPQAV